MAPGNADLQHNVPRLSVTVGAETLTADFQEFFERTGGLQRWGFPTSEVHVEETGTLTQYYQRGVVDFHRRVDLGNIYVLERRLTWDYFGGGQGGSPDLGVEPGTVNNNTGEQLGPWNHKVSNFSVGGVRTGFLDFFHAFGGVQAFGFPKTEARRRHQRGRHRTHCGGHGPGSRGNTSRPRSWNITRWIRRLR